MVILFSVFGKHTLKSFPKKMNSAFSFFSLWILIDVDLLYGNRFGKIPRLVYVATAHHGDVIG